MPDPISPERLAEIREADGQFPLLPSAASVYGHRRALLAEVDRLTRELDDANQLAADRLRVLDSIATEAATEKSRRELMEDAFNEVRASRDRLVARNAELAARVAELELVPRCGAMTPSAFINAEPLGPCILDHGHGGMHEEASPARWPPHPGARWTERNDPLAVAHARIRELEAEREQLGTEWAIHAEEPGQLPVIAVIDTEGNARTGAITARANVRRRVVVSVRSRLVGPWRNADETATEGTADVQR